MVSTDGEEKKKKPHDSAFKQQTLPAWQPILTPNWVIGTFFVVAIIFIPIGAIVLSFSNKVVEVSARYDNVCYDEYCTGGAATCSDWQAKDCDKVTITVNENMEAPVYLYYKLTTFYQNHRRYVKSRSDRQLRGDDVDDDDTSDCSPKQKVDDKMIYPCGLIADSMFSDVFGKCQNSAGGLTTTYGDCRVTDCGDCVPSSETFRFLHAQGDEASRWYIRESGVAWQSDVDDKFKVDKHNAATVDRSSKYTNITDSGSGALALLNVAASEYSSSYRLSEHFIVWMRTAGLPTFMKLWGVIDKDIPAGTTLQIPIYNQFDTYAFSGEKHVVLSTTEWIGGKNDFLGIAYIVVGCLCGVLCLFFFVKHKMSPRKLGDPQYLIWNRDSRE